MDSKEIRSDLEFDKNAQGPYLANSINPQPTILEQIRILLDNKIEEDIPSFFRIYLQQAREILGVNSISVYIARSDKPGMFKIAFLGSEHFTPNTIPSNELGIHTRPTLWKFPNPVISKLQKNVETAGYRYLATFPMGNGGAVSGLIAGGGYELEAVEGLLPKLGLIGKIIESSIERKILFDTTKSKAEQQKKRNKTLERIMSNIKDAVLIINRNLKISEMNNSAEQMFGYSINEVIGRPIDDVLIGADGLMDAIEIALSGNEVHKMGLVSLHRRSGHAFAAQVQLLPGVFESGSKQGIIILISDESENEQNRIKVQHLEQRAALGSLSAIFAHEVRNPINNISTGIQLIRTRIPAEDSNYDAFVRIQNDCNRLTTLVESVLAYSRPIEPKIRPLDISAQVTHMLERWRPRFERLGISSSLQAPAEPIIISGDYRLLDQVFTNLISNAVDVMDQTGGILTIKLSFNDLVSSFPQVEIAISDTGPGIPDDIIERVFEPFLTTKTKGTGLGLAITKQMITAMKGTIRVSSFPGGSVFFITLPRYTGA